MPFVLAMQAESNYSTLCQDEVCVQPLRRPVGNKPLWFQCFCPSLSEIVLFIYEFHGICYTSRNE